VTVKRWKNFEDRLSFLDTMPELVGCKRRNVQTDADTDRQADGQHNPYCAEYRPEKLDLSL